VPRAHETRAGEAATKAIVGADPIKTISKRTCVVRRKVKCRLACDLAMCGYVTGDGRQPVTQALCDSETIPFISGWVYGPERSAAQFVEYAFGDPADESDATANSETLHLVLECTQPSFARSGEDDERTGRGRKLRERPKHGFDALVGAERADDK
jgi:hypothetical protein